MCEIFGTSTKEPVLLNEWLRTFFSHADMHPHGWGLSVPMSGTPVTCEKEPENAVKSNYLKYRLRAEIRAAGVLAHIRFATKGGLCYENTHPFIMNDESGRTWTLVHNGTIFECDALNKYLFHQQGQTDSERILCHLIRQMDIAQEMSGQPLSASERFNILEAMIAGIAPGNKLNLLIHDGEILYAHTNYRESLFIHKPESGIYIATKPLNLGHWDPLPMNTLLSFKDGKLLQAGTAHDHEFYDDEEKMRLLFLDYADL